jgi:pimeloyl-ACP methyl ester carboxylesterase
MTPADGELDWHGHRLTYSDYGEGERALVLMHGLLMNRRMFDRLAPEMASRGYRVVTIDVLGHGRSDRPEDMRLYSMPAFGDQLAALVEHLELDRPVVGGTSLGANAALEFAHAHPGKSRALLLEMPVLDNALLGAALVFTPVLLGLRFGRPLLRPLAAGLRRVPRTHYLVDIGLDWLRQDPAPSSGVLEGLFLGSAAPHHGLRVKMQQPTLVIGHHADPLHPFSDSGMLAEELPKARLIEASSILEWRISPSRLDDELAGFLEEVWEQGERGETAEAALRELR